MVSSVDCAFFFDDELVGERGMPGAMDACALCDKLLAREDDIFMYACALCDKLLAREDDIFMYRGDIPFCSDECRHQQMRLDDACARKAGRLLQPYSSGTVPRPQESRKVSVASL